MLPLQGAIQSLLAYHRGAEMKDVSEQVVRPCKAGAGSNLCRHSYASLVCRKGSIISDK